MAFFFVFLLFHRISGPCTSISCGDPTATPEARRTPKMRKNMRSMTCFVIFLLIFVMNYGELGVWVWAKPMMTNDGGRS